MRCRHCQAELVNEFLDLGFAPPSNAYVTESDLSKPEKYFPLKIMVCDKCWLVQTEDYTEAEDLFNAEYAYFSSTSSTFLSHAKEYTSKMIAKLKLNKSSYVIEVASNDGYLLKNFLDEEIPCLGIEPTASTAQAAKKIGIPVIEEFFGEDLALKLKNQSQSADLIIGNNVYAHVPDINDFTLGLKIALKEGGTITLEFPHLMQLINHNQFDTIYHEHFSYLSLYTVSKIFKKAGLRIFDVDEIQTHGGSLRVYGCHDSDDRRNTSNVIEMLNKEESHGLLDLATYKNFQFYADEIKNNLLTFLIEQKKQDKLVVAYGAAAKGNTLLNYAGVKHDLVKFVCDGASAKQGKFMPGSHIPIFHPDALKEINPDYILILPWNISDEIIEMNKNLFPNAKFVVAVPSLKFL